MVKIIVKQKGDITKDPVKIITRNILMRTLSHFGNWESKITIVCQLDRLI